MNLAFDSNAEEYANALREFMQFYSIEIPKALRRQGRLLAQELIKKTPPNTRAQGRRAVERDIKRAVRPLRPQDFASKEIRRLIRKRDYGALQAAFRYFRGNSDLQNVRVVPFDPKMHTEARDRRGRVKRFQRKATPDYEEVAAYIKQVQAHVGEARGGWAASLLALGRRPAGWIAEHSNAGRFTDHADDLVRQYIQMTNESEWAGDGDEDRVIANSLRSRSIAMLNDLARAQERALQQHALF